VGTSIIRGTIMGAVVVAEQRNILDNLAEMVEGNMGAIF
jgi:hypothetical protein